MAQGMFSFLKVSIFPIKQAVYASNHRLMKTINPFNQVLTLVRPRAPPGKVAANCTFLPGKRYRAIRGKFFQAELERSDGRQDLSG